MKKQILFDTTKYLAFAFANNKTIHKSIDLFMKNYNIHITKTYMEKNENINCSLEIYSYYKKFKYTFEIVSVPNIKVFNTQYLTNRSSEYFEDLQDNIIDFILQKIDENWNYISKYIDQRKQVQIGVFIKTYIRKFGMLDTKDFKIILTIFITKAFQVNKLINDNELYDLMECFYLQDINDTKKSLYLDTFKYSNRPKEVRIWANKLYSKIENQIQPSMHLNNLIYLINEKLPETNVNLHALSIDFIKSKYIIDAAEITDYTFTETDIKEFLIMYREFLENSNLSTEIEKINLDDLFIWLYDAFNISLYQKAYIEAREFFIHNNPEALSNELYRVSEKNKQLETAINKLNTDNEDLLKKIELLKSDLSKSQAKINRFEKTKYEITTMKNFIYNSQEDTIISPSLSFEDKLNFLNNKNGVIFGGDTYWIQKMKSLLPAWSFVSATSYNFNKSILKNKDLVAINAKYIYKHALTYRIINNCDNYVYINNRNPNIAINELYNLINK